MVCWVREARAMATTDERWPENGRETGRRAESGERIGCVTGGVISCGSSDMEEGRRNRKGLIDTNSTKVWRKWITE